MSNPTTGPLMDQEESYENTNSIDAAKLLYNTGDLRGACSGEIIASEAHSMSVPVSDTRKGSNEPYSPPTSQDMKWDRPNFKPVVTP